MTKQIDPVKANAERWLRNEHHSLFMCQLFMDMSLARKCGVSKQELRKTLLRMQREDRKTMELFIKS